MIEQAGDAQTILTKQRKAFRADPFPDLAARHDRLDRIGKLARDHQDALCAAISQDFGNRSPHETIMLEIAPIMGALRHTRSHLKSWMKPQARGRSIEFLQVANRVQHQPLGVVGIMAPWNYPLFLTLGPLIDVLAAGNRAMIKPSELLPETSALLAELVARHFAPEEVAVITGGVDVAAEFASLPFDHLLFTGSTAIGRKVMAAAAQNLTPVTLELGGKSPAIIAPDYPIADAVRSVAFGKLMNAGQTCIAPDYILLERSKMQEFADRFVAEAERFYPARKEAQNYTSLVGARALDRLRDGIEECKSRGARILSADARLAEKGNSLAPTVVLDAPGDCRLMQDEIFGPVLPLVAYDDLNQALDFVNDRPRPLALYGFSHDKEVQDKIVRETVSGNVTINGTLVHIAQNDLPFGGVGPSGIGAYHGREGFVRFSHAKGIAKVKLFDPTRLLTPPYGAVAKILAKFMTR